MLAPNRFRIGAPCARMAACQSAFLVALSGVLVATEGMANPAEAPPGFLPPLMGSDPRAPGAYTVLPNPAERLLPEDYVLEIHGFGSAPMYIGFHQRDNPAEGQSSLTLQSPPNVPWINPEDWGEVNSIDGQPNAAISFNFGRKDLYGAMVFATRRFNQGFFIEDSPLQIQTTVVGGELERLFGSDVSLDALAGGYVRAYGLAGRRTRGRYFTALHGAVSGFGEIIGLEYEKSGLTVRLEHGFAVRPGGDFAQGLFTAVDREELDEQVDFGTSTALHHHIAARYANITVRGHLFNVSMNDNVQLEAEDNELAEAGMRIVGADAHVSGYPWGDIFVGISQLDASTVRNLGPVVVPMNAVGGEGLNRAFFGQGEEGTGTVRSLLVQYDFSLARLLYHPVPFDGWGPDLRFQAAALVNDVYGDEDFRKAKFGFGIEYQPLSWIGFRGDYDEVHPNLDNGSQSFSLYSLGTFLRSDFTGAPEEVLLQYQFAQYGSDVTGVTGPGVPLDNHTALLRAAIGW